MGHSARGEHSSRSFEHGEDGDGTEGMEREDEDEEEEEEPSALEKILPQFPASRKEVFLKVEAVLGLLPPFTARGSAVSAKVFWGGQEVKTRKQTPHSHKKLIAKRVIFLQTVPGGVIDFNEAWMVRYEVEVAVRTTLSGLGCFAPLYSR